MADVTINYEGGTIATMSASGTKTLLTEGKYCTDDIEVVYVSPGGGGISIDGIFTGSEPVGDITIGVSAPGSANRERVFMHCTNITGVSAPLLTSLRSQTFTDCYGLISADFPSLTTLNGSSHFQSCNNLTDVNIPLLTSLSSSMFNSCSKLELIDLPKVTSLNVNRAFYNCSKLQTIILRHTSLVPLGADTLSNTPFAGAGGLTGTLYVPSALVSSYQTATNWSTFYNGGTMTVSSIEGSQYE